MSSIEIYIVAEGPTEQTFVRHVLAPQMAVKGIYLIPTLIGESGHRGGDIRFDRVKKDISNFIKQRNDTFVSTMFDFFQIDENWPGKDEVDSRISTGATLSASKKADILETKTHKEISRLLPDFDVGKRFIPYIAMHEFEALLFSDGQILAEKTNIDPAGIQRIINDFPNPEEINDDQAPSKRLLALKKGYRKVAMGKVIAEAIGINSMRRVCPHFDHWLSKLENLSG